MKLPVTKRGMIQTALGSVFYLLSDGRNIPQNTTTSSGGTCAERAPILCFHMSPRSSDEYLEVLPLLASDMSLIDNNGSNGGRIVIAFDAPGYGASENPYRSCTIDEISDAFLMAADSILSEIIANSNGDGDERRLASDSTKRDYITVGSLLGNYFCVSLASRYPERIKAGILTNPWYNPTASGSSSTFDVTDPATSTVIEDSFVLKDDGSHLVELHSKRSRFLDPELNFRVVHSEISYLANRRIRYSKGIKIQGGQEYDFETPVKKIVEMRHGSGAKIACCNFLCVIAESCASSFDRIGLDGTNRFNDACEMLLGGGVDNATGSGNNDVQIERLVGEKSTLNVVNQMPEEFAAICNRFLSERGL